jgi:VanZ family protein
MAFTGPGGVAVNPRNRALVRVIVPLALMGVIFFLSAQPAAGHHAWWVIVFRKLGHVTGYALLTAAWAWALRGVVERPILWAVCISLAYACTDEYHQTFVDGRTGTPIDVGVDAIGMAIAASLINRRPQAARTKPGKDAGGPATRAYEPGT